MTTTDLQAVLLVRAHMHYLVEHGQITRKQAANVLRSLRDKLRERI